MKKIVLFSIFYLFGLGNMFAGHHFESDLAKKNPQLDLTDIYVFKAPDADKTVFIMAFNPKSKKDSISNYASNGIYRFCIGIDKDFSKGFSPTFTFKNNKIQFYIANSPEPSVSELGTFIGEGPIDKTIKFTNGIDLWTGTVYDLFFGNALGIDVFRNKMKDGIFDLSAFNIGQQGNVFENLESSVIVFQIPNKYLSKNIHYYATTAVEESANHWHRVNRIGYVLFPHTYLLDPEKKYIYLNSNHETQTDVYQAIYDNVLKYVTAAGFQKNPKIYTEQLLVRIYPDVMSYQVGTDAVYEINNINGRPLRADAMNVALALLIGAETPVDDQVNIINDRYQDTFPYVVPIDSNYSDSNNIVEVNANHLDFNFNDKNQDVGNQVENNSSSLSITTWTILGVVLLLIIIGYSIRRKNK